MKSSGFYPQRQHSDSSHTNPCTFFSSLTYLRALKKHEFLYKSKFLITQWTFLSQVIPVAHPVVSLSFFQRLVFSTCCWRSNSSRKNLMRIFWTRNRPSSGILPNKSAKRWVSEQLKKQLLYTWSFEYFSRAVSRIPVEVSHDADLLQLHTTLFNFFSLSRFLLYWYHSQDSSVPRWSRPGTSCIMGNIVPRNPCAW